MHSDPVQIRHDLLYYIDPGQHQTETIRELMLEHPEIRFISLAAIDLAGNDTDEKSPVSLFLDNIDGYLHGGVQTDGSSVVLPGIATLNDGKVDLIADPDVRWFVDYNYEHRLIDDGKPCGTLRIPAF